jgi:hypothetical protein
MLWYIYIALICFNLVASFARWKYLSPPLKVLSGLLGWGLLIEICRELADKETAGILTHVNLSLELLFQLVYYYLLLEKRKRVFLYAGIVFYVVALSITWGVNPGFFKERYYLDGVFLGVCMTLWCGLFFYELMQKPLQYSLKSDGNFWVNCGNILFYPGTLLLFGLGNYMEQINPELWQSLKSINYALNLALYALYLAAFCKDRKQQVQVNHNIFGRLSL